VIRDGKEKRGKTSAVEVTQCVKRGNGKEGKMEKKK